MTPGKLVTSAPDLVHPNLANNLFASSATPASDHRLRHSYLVIKLVVGQTELGQHRFTVWTSTCCGAQCGRDITMEERS